MSERDDRMQEAWKMLNESGAIEWHCRRHGVIRNIGRNDQNLLNEVIIYFMGPKSAWWKDGNVEFSNTTKVYPPQKKPWEWCGETVLFKDWQKREEENRNAAQSFRIGDLVYFMDKGKRIDGIVANITKRVTVIIPGQEMRWYVPPTQLYKA